jgi:hypothetical protein
MIFPCFFQQSTAQYRNAEKRYQTLQKIMALICNISTASLPVEIIDYSLSFSGLKSLAVSARVCKEWYPFAQKRLNEFKFAEIDILREVFSNLIFFQRIKKDSDLLEEIESAPLDLSKEKIPIKNRSTLRKMSEAFNATFHKEQEGRYTRLEKAIENRVRLSKATFALDFADLISCPLYRFAIANYQPPKGISYLSCKNFKNQLELLPNVQDKSTLALTRGVCEDVEVMGILKNILPKCPHIRLIFLASIYVDENTNPTDKQEAKPNTNPIQNLCEIFTKKTKLSGLRTKHFSLNDKDAHLISLLIREHKLSGCYMVEENNITNAGLKMIAEAINVATSFYFRFASSKKERIAEGLELLESLDRKNGLIQIRIE